MAYIIGQATDAEIEELKRRGWDIEEPPPDYTTEDVSKNIGEPLEEKMIMIFVDQDLFKIMSGPDWEQ